MCSPQFSLCIGLLIIKIVFINNYITQSLSITVCSVRDPVSTKNQTKPREKIRRVVLTVCRQWPLIFRPTSIDFLIGEHFSCRTHVLKEKAFIYIRINSLGKPFVLTLTLFVKTGGTFMLLLKWKNQMTVFPVLKEEDTENLHFYSIRKKMLCFATELRGGFIFIVTFRITFFIFFQKHPK